ncbi:MAG: hypothetical protein AB7S41_08980 [Parvibaculaceae bacterium]
MLDWLGDNAHLIQALSVAGLMLIGTLRLCHRLAPAPPLLRPRPKPPRKIDWPAPQPVSALMVALRAADNALRQEDDEWWPGIETIRQPFPWVRG